MLNFPEKSSVIPRLRPGLQRLVLTGFMGAGKSTVGKLLAERSGWEFLDLDTYIETTQGKTARELFDALGETGFRQLETDLWASVLQREHAIIAPGGAVIDKLENQKLLAENSGSFVVFLDGPFDVLIERCLNQERSGGATYRPLLHKTEVAHARFQERRKLYAAHTQMIVDVGAQPPQEAAAIIWRDFFTRS